MHARAISIILRLGSLGHYWSSELTQELQTEEATSTIGIELFKAELLDKKYWNSLTGSAISRMTRSSCMMEASQDILKSNYEMRTTR